MQRLLQGGRCACLPSSVIANDDDDDDDDDVFSSYAPVSTYEYHIGHSDEIRPLASNDGVIICENGHRAVLASEV